jgi:hypothetical protein
MKLVDVRKQFNTEDKWLDYIEKMCWPNDELGCIHRGEVGCIPKGAY